MNAPPSSKRFHQRHRPILLYWRSVFLCLTLCGLGTIKSLAGAGDALCFHAEWDGNTDAMLNGMPLLPTVAEQIDWARRDESGKALALSPGARLEYNVSAKFPSATGSLEFHMRPLRAPDKECDVLRIRCAEESSIILTFVPAGPRWVFRLQSRGAAAEIAAWRDEIKYDQWNHLVLTWGDDATVALCVDGKQLRSQPFAGRLGEQATVGLLGPSGTDVTIGPLLIYNRCLTPPQALLLRQIFGHPAADRLARIKKQIDADDQAAAQRRELVSRLKGKVGRVYHTRGRTAGPVPLPEGIIAEGIRPEDIGKTDLRAFRVIYFPQGPNYQIEPSQYAAIQTYVKGGGGYVGDCQGAYFAADKLKLLPIECYHNNIWGLYKIGVTPHFVTDQSRGETIMHFGNGPIMVPGKGCEVFGTYAMKLPGNAVPAAMIAGTYGTGRVILFGPHPLGEKVAFKGTSAHFSGKLLGTERMFVNALLLAAGLVNDDGRPQP